MLNKHEHISLIKSNQSLLSSIPAIHEFSFVVEANKELFQPNNKTYMFSSLAMKPFHTLKINKSIQEAVPFCIPEG